MLSRNPFLAVACVCLTLGGCQNVDHAVVASRGGPLIFSALSAGSDRQTVDAYLARRGYASQGRPLEGDVEYRREKANYPCLVRYEITAHFDASDRLESLHGKATPLACT